MHVPTPLPIVHLELVASFKELVDTGLPEKAFDAFADCVRIAMQREEDDLRPCGGGERNSRRFTEDRWGAVLPTLETIKRALGCFPKNRHRAARGSRDHPELGRTRA